VEIARRQDALRMLAAGAAAILVHVGLFFGIPFLTSLDMAPLPDYGPIVVTLEVPAAAFVTPPAAPPPPAPKPTPVAAATPAPSPRSTPGPTPAAAPKLALDAGAAPAPHRAPGTSSFRQAGTSTGTSAGTARESIVAGPPPVILPSVGTSSTPGSGEQHSGAAVPVTPGAHATGSTGSLDTRKLDASLAAVAGSGTATAASAGSPGATSRSPRGADIVWDNPTAARGREYRKPPQPKLPEWARTSGRLPEVLIRFSVNADGLVTSALVQQGSGYTDVDEACRKAMLQATFTPAPGAPEISGVQRFTPELVR
jgi:TonB family protein